MPFAAFFELGLFSSSQKREEIAQYGLFHGTAPRKKKKQKPIYSHANKGMGRHLNDVSTEGGSSKPDNGKRLFQEMQKH